MRGPCVLFLLILLLLPVTAGGNPTVLLDLPVDLNTFSTPVVEVAGTVENSLTWPTGVSEAVHHGFRTWVYFSVAGKPFEVARTVGSGPDWNAHYGKTGSVALFRGFGDLPFGTHSVRVYAKDEFGRISTTVTRTIYYPQPRSGLADKESVKKGVSILHDLCSEMVFLAPHVPEKLRATRENVVIWLGNQLKLLPDSDVVSITPDLEGISISEDEEAFRSSISDLLMSVRLLNLDRMKNP